MKKLNAYYEKLFKQLKIKKGDKIVVHSNLFTFGFNSPKLPKIIIRNLKLAVGFGGAIIMPLYTFERSTTHVFDKKKIYKNKYTSLLSEIFFKEKKVIRSNCPIHSHIGYGKKSDILLQSNPSNTYGRKSDFQLMKINKFKLLLLGCSAQEGATYFHQVEAMENTSYGKWISFEKKIILNNKIKKMRVNFFEKKKVRHNLNKSLELISKKSKTYISFKNKYYSSSIIDIDELHKLTSIQLKKNPYFLVKHAK
tara:strand:+ start:19 stop:774 length:756 start_codon:yes stop_codon:yes gene_type:complete